MSVPVGAEEERALRAAQGGDREAFNHLVRLHQRRVYNLCYRLLGDADDAADATQECFLHAYRAIGGFRGAGGAFVGWLLRIAANGCYDVQRRRKRRPSESLDAPCDPEDASRRARLDPPDPAPGPVERTLAAETTRWIDEGLKRLSREQRLVVVLCDVQGMSYEEAAAVVGAELGTVKSRLSRARAQLRDFLAGRGELPSATRRLDE